VTTKETMRRSTPLILYDLKNLLWQWPMNHSISLGQLLSPGPMSPVPFALTPTRLGGKKKLSAPPRDLTGSNVSPPSDPEYMAWGGEGKGVMAYVLDDGFDTNNQVRMFVQSPGFTDIDRTFKPGIA
jgi:hypothetical protein